MRLFKMKNSPYWWVDFTVSKRRYRKSTGRLLSDKKGAQRVMAQEYERMMNISQLGEKPEITLDEAFELTLAEVEGQTRRIYSAAREALSASLRGDSTLSGLTTSDVDNFVSVRRKQGRKPNTIRCDLKALKRVMNRVRTTHRVNMDIAWPKIEAFKKTRYLSDLEEAQVLRNLSRDAEDNITAEKAYYLCVFLLDTGMRLMEAVDLDWATIDLSSGVIEVYRPKTKTVSTVPISDRVRTLLNRYHNQDRPFVKMEWAIRHLRKAVDEVCNQNQRIADQRGKATIHTLRDTYASRMVKRGLSLHKLAKLMGHTNTAMTSKYSHLEVNDVVAEARALMAG